MSKNNSSILSQLKLTPESTVDGLVPVSETLPSNISISEKRIIHETIKIREDIDFIFFRRFTENDVRTSQAVAYIIDNSLRKLTNEEIARLHHTLWLNGTVPLLYIDTLLSGLTLKTLQIWLYRIIKFWFKSICT